MAGPAGAVVDARVRLGGQEIGMSKRIGRTTVGAGESRPPGTR
ncbi:MAG: hypothetical protein ACREKJ_07315 [Candidatus Rokuibacteriota bacterium]